MIMNEVKPIVVRMFTSAIVVKLFIYICATLLKVPFSANNLATASLTTTRIETQYAECGKWKGRAELWWQEVK